MRIGEVVRRSGVSAHTIRFYEAQRILSRPSRSAAGYRQYSDRVLRELRFVQRAQRLGFTLAETRQILGLGRSGRTPCAKVLALCDAHLEAIDRRMAELLTFRQNLQNVKRLTEGTCGVTAEGFCLAVFAETDAR
jgi:MerR family copper efflux transcriptional regulator